jgi:multidrug efflux pump
VHAFLAGCFHHARTVILAFVGILIAGTLAWFTIPKESSPDVPIPIIYVHMVLSGVAPEDAERLLARPMEIELQSIEGLKKMTSTSGEGFASVLLEFDAGFDADTALSDVRLKVDQAKAKLPDSAEEPTVNEVNVALFPVLTVTLSGPLSERSLLQTARRLKERIESVPGVLEVDIGGDREEMVEILVDPTVLETYGVSFADVISFVSTNNQLVAAGAIDTGAGRMVLKVPGTIDDLDDLLTMPVKAVGGRVVTFGDVAQVRRGFVDPEGFARVDGQAAVTLEIKKRLGANIIETVQAVRDAVASAQQAWPQEIAVGFLQDASNEIRVTLNDLVNNVIAAVLIVLLIIVMAMGVRSGLLVGIAIPGSMLMGFVVLQLLGVTINIVVLFSLILVIGLLVDDSIVVSEYADRKMAEGMSPPDAYLTAAKRMLWPITGATLTKIAVFAPLLFWPGIIGGFMYYLPLTVIIMLTASLIVALVFLPVIGGIFGRAVKITHELSETIPIAEIRGITGAYVRLLARLVKRPLITLAIALVAMIGMFYAYSIFGRGTDFFPEIEPEFGQVAIHARGDLSVWEKEALVGRVEERILEMPEFAIVYARTYGAASRDLGEDVIGTVQLEMVPWDQRPTAAVLFDRIRERTADIPGVVVEVQGAQQGPGEAKPINLEIRSADSALLVPATEAIRAAMEQIGGFVDTTDSRPLPGIEWQITVDRQRAAEMGANVAMIGSAIQMVTRGVKVAGYRPEDSDDEIDINVRFPAGDRTLDALERLRIQTSSGLVPLSNFVTMLPAPKTGVLTRIDGLRTMTIASDIQAGLLANDQVAKLQAAIDGMNLPAGVTVAFTGDQEQQQETGTFLMVAFVTAIILMVLVLLMEFNSFYQVALVMSGIVLSTAGVLLGLMVTGQTFGVVMCGIGIIALAGIVVNNNIILIDAYNDFRQRGLDPVEAAVRTGSQRLRPVFLTAFAMVLGLFPMVIEMTPDFFMREITFGAPSSQWWTQLSAAISGGLAFATVLTLFLTPCMLVLGDKVQARGRARRQRRAERRAARAAKKAGGALPTPAE